MADREPKDILAAIVLVQDYLRSEYIVDECRADPTAGCASCDAVELERRLDALAEMIAD